MHHSAIRLSKLKKSLSAKNLDGAIITKKENIFYLTGTYLPHPNHREAVLFITKDHALLYHSPFINASRSSFYSSTPMSRPADLNKHLHSIFTPHIRNIAIESHDLTVNELDKYSSILPNKNFFKEMDLVEKIRLIKDRSEINSIKRSCRITQKCMRWSINYIRSHADSLTEDQAAQKIANKFKLFGADEIAFPVIVACDSNSASPHHQPTNKTISSNSIVLIDIGCKLGGYCSDMTRTISIGKPSSKFLEIKSIVEHAYSTAVVDFTQSSTASSLDKATRFHIKAEGYAKHFIHTTGHGIGLEIHEPPSLNHKNPDVIKPNMTFTIEPGIYLKGQFGFRHENTFLSHRHQLESLTG